MKVIRGLVLTLASALAIATSAHAASINLVSGTAGSIPATGTVSDFIVPGFFPGPQIGGYFGAQISVIAPVPSTIVFEFFGADALYHNEFNFFGSELFDHAGSPSPIVAPNLGAPLNSARFLIVGSGLLPFSFDIDSDRAHVTNGTNGGQPEDIFATCNPFSSVAGAGGTACDSVYLFLDDSGAVDTDHDDFLVRVTVTPVPEPATVGLLGLGLLGLVGRRVRAWRHTIESLDLKRGPGK